MITDKKVLEDFEWKIEPRFKGLQFIPSQYPKFETFERQIKSISNEFENFLTKQTMQDQTKVSLVKRFNGLVEQKSKEHEFKKSTLSKKIEKIALLTINAIANYLKGEKFHYSQEESIFELKKEYTDENSIMDRLMNGEVAFPADDPYSAFEILKKSFSRLGEIPTKVNQIPALDALLISLIDSSIDNGAALKHSFPEAEALIESLIENKPRSTI